MKHFILLTILSFNLCFGQTLSTFCQFGSGHNFESICISPGGDFFVADKNSHVIQKITAAGVSSVFAGSGNAGFADGNGTAASFNLPTGIVCDASGNLFVTDNANYRIRKIDPSGNVTTLAGSSTSGTTDGTGSAASFTSPWGICLTSSGDLLVTDHYGWKVRKVTTSGVVTTFINTGFVLPYGICEGSNGDIYLALRNNQVIERYSSSGAYIGLFAGTYNSTGSTDGSATIARFNSPQGLFMDSNDNLYVTDSGNQRLRRVNQNGDVVTVAGNGGAACNDGPALTSNFWGPAGICTDGTGDLFITDYFCCSVRKLSGLPVGINNTIKPSSPTTIYPNPATEELSVILKDNFSLNNGLNIAIYSTTGSLLYKNKETAEKTKIDLTKFNDSMFLVVITNDEGDLIQKELIIRN